MTPEEKKQLELMQQDVNALKKASIQLNIDPTVYLYLKQTVDKFITESISKLPTTTISNSPPSGTDFNNGSLWFKNSGTLATREIYVFDGTSWTQYK